MYVFSWYYVIYIKRLYCLGYIGSYVFLDEGYFGCYGKGF